MRIDAVCLLCGMTMMTLSHCTNIAVENFSCILSIQHMPSCTRLNQQLKKFEKGITFVYNIAKPNTPISSAAGAAKWDAAPVASTGADLVADGDPWLAVALLPLVVRPEMYPLKLPVPTATPEGSSALVVTSVLCALAVLVSYAGTLTPAALEDSSLSFSLSLSAEEADDDSAVAVAEPHPGRKSGE